MGHGKDRREERGSAEKEEKRKRKRMGKGGGIREGERKAENYPIPGSRPLSILLHLALCPRRWTYKDVIQNTPLLWLPLGLSNGEGGQVNGRRRENEVSIFISLQSVSEKLPGARLSLLSVGHLSSQRHPLPIFSHSFDPVTMGLGLGTASPLLLALGSRSNPRSSPWLPQYCCKQTLFRCSTCLLLGLWDWGRKWAVVRILWKMLWRGGT